MLSSRTWRRRRLEKWLEEVGDPDAVLDVGVRIYVVRPNPDGKVTHGTEPVAAVACHEFGGMFDPLQQRWVGPSRNPVIWCLSELQFPLAVHGLPCNCCGIAHGGDLPLNVMALGAMGSGKTRGVLAPWLGLRCLEYAGSNGEIGATVPTGEKSEALRKALEALVPPEWYHYFAARGVFEFRFGVDLRVIGTASSKHGSRIQAWNWLAAGSDEIQDTIEDNVDYDSDIEARGRAAPGGQYKRMVTATARGTPTWKNWRDSLAPEFWAIRTFPGTSNPFVSPAIWERYKKTMPPRAYARKVLAQDVGPENAVYPEYDRKIHLRPYPQFSRDLTTQALAAYSSYSREGAHFEMLIGHDPGETKHTSTLLKCFLYSHDPGAAPLVPTWFVIDEFITERTTSREHAKQLRAYLQRKYGLEQRPDRFGEASTGKALIFCDPHGKGEDRPDYDAYQSFQKEKLDIFRASEERIKRRTRIDMVRRLLGTEDGTRRLFFAADEQKQPMAPETVAGFETLERDHKGRPEQDRKGKGDKTHGPVSVGYALFPLELEALTDFTQHQAMRGTR